MDADWKCRACLCVGFGEVSEDSETLQQIITCECGHSEVYNGS